MIQLNDCTAGGLEEEWRMMIVLQYNTNTIDKI
jgi:hypothetical protein